MKVLIKAPNKKSPHLQGKSIITLFYENSEKLLQSYNIRVYPTCYLIGPDGKLIQSPATLPTEGLEQQLFRIMRARGDL